MRTSTCLAAGDTATPTGASALADKPAFVRLHGPAWTVRSTTGALSRYERADAVLAALEPGDVDDTLIQIHLRPPHGYCLADTQTMAVDHADQHPAA